MAGLWLALGVQTSWLAVLAGLALALLMVLALIDARTGYLPDALTLPFLVLGLAAGLGQGGLQALNSMALGLAAALSVPGLCMGLFWLRHRQAGLGWGDVKLLAGMGVWLGAQGVIMALLMACVCGLAFALCRNRGLRLQAGYPFGPFLALGTVLVMLRIL
jgi:leader peptidase (prepilin peptidase)/N-methyltransferase